MHVAAGPDEVAGISALLREMLDDEETGWYIGTFGALGEFHHVEGEAAPPVKALDNGGEMVTDRGGIRVATLPGILPLAHEGLSARPDAWTHGMAFCLPINSARMNERNGLTELGPDHDSIRGADRESILFDLGLGAPHVDCCIRVADDHLVAHLRQRVGTNVLDPSSSAMAAIVASSPHRVFISRLGRVEVYQHIPSAAKGMKSPTGPHTHVLPDLLRHKRTHSANLPVPDGWVPALHLSPQNPVTDRLGKPRAFDRVAFDAFQDLLDRFALPSDVSEKRRIRQAVHAGDRSDEYTPADTRSARKAARVALRQMQHTDPDLPSLDGWIAAFDRGAGTCEADTGRG